MPRYYFDTDDGFTSHHDDTGQELPNAKAARREAVAVLPAMACDKLPNGDRRDLDVRVRNEANTLIYTASLSFVGEWHVTPLAA